MKSSLNPNYPARIIPFPKLMINDTGQVYLMTDQYNGVCVHSSDKYNIGYVAYNMREQYLSDYYGNVTIANS